MPADNAVLPMDPQVPYDTVREQLATGDLIFLQTASTQGLWIERIEEWFDMPPFSHVGMVIKHGHDLLLWDAPGGGACFCDPYAFRDPDNPMHGSHVHPGCRVSVLDEVLGYYQTRTKPDVPGFWVRKLTPPASEDQFTALRGFINGVDGSPFPIEHGYTALLANFLAGQFGRTLFVGTYFCSQLVAGSYMKMGRLLETHTRPPNAYAPAHFGIETMNFGGTNPPAWVPGTDLGQAIFVSWDMEERHGTPCEQEAW